MSVPQGRTEALTNAVCAHTALNWDAAVATCGGIALGHGAELPPYER